jgi:hypothetical protein
MAKNGFRWLEFLAILLALFGIWLTIVSSSPINLKVWHNISSDQKQLYVYVQNNDWFRGTGDIDLYKLEINPFRPHMRFTGNQTVGPRKMKLLATLAIKVNQSKEVILSKNLSHGAIPASLAYYINEGISISYKVTCTNCRTDGYIQRIPDYQTIHFNMVMDSDKNQLRASIPVYVWVQANLEDFYQKYNST